jgi:hypothetical protein
MGRGHAIRAQDIWHWYQVGDCRAFARRLCVAAQLGSINAPAPEDSMWCAPQVVLGDARLLHSVFRKYLVDRRDDFAQLIVDTDQRQSLQRPVRSIGDGQFELRARPVLPLWSWRGPSADGRAVVLVALGDGSDDYEVIGLSVPDARQLVALLHEALDAPALVTS